MNTGSVNHVPGKDKPLTIEQRAGRIAYDSGMPVSFALLVLKLEERVAALEAKLAEVK